ncbi:MAG: PaaI family thioesterase [Polaromonas sp.]
MTTLDTRAEPPQQSQLFQRIEASFLRQGLMQHLGARLVAVSPGVCEVALPHAACVTQQQGGFHGGAMGALADIAGGYAALTQLPDDLEVVTVEYKVNFLASFTSGELRAVGRVAKAGKRIIVTTAEVTHVDASGKATPCALMQQTLVPVPKTY